MNFNTFSDSPTVLQNFVSKASFRSLDSIFRKERNQEFELLFYNTKFNLGSLSAAIAIVIVFKVVNVGLEQRIPDGVRAKNRTIKNDLQILSTLLPSKDGGCWKMTKKLTLSGLGATAASYAFTASVALNFLLPIFCTAAFSASFGHREAATEATYLFTPTSLIVYI